MRNPSAYPPELFRTRWIEEWGPFARGPYSSDTALIAALVEQESALKAFASGDGFEPKRLQEFAFDRVAGGAEHEVYLPTGAGPHAYVWKITHADRWGLIRATPIEYLDRLALLDKASGTNIRVEGVAINSNGQPRLVTSMNYVHGVHPSGPKLAERLKIEGWEQVFDPDQMLSYRHVTSLVTMRDAHPKNFIVTRRDALVPIDVIFSA